MGLPEGRRCHRTELGGEFFLEQMLTFEKSTCAFPDALNLISCQFLNLTDEILPCPETLNTEQEQCHLDTSLCSFDSTDEGLRGKC